MMLFGAACFVLAAIMIGVAAGLLLALTFWVGRR